MANDNFSASDALLTVVEADEYRAEVTLQYYAGDNVYVGINELPVVGSGIRLGSDTPVLSIFGVRSRGKVYLLCDTGETATGGIHTC